MTPLWHWLAEKVLPRASYTSHLTPMRSDHMLPPRLPRMTTMSDPTPEPQPEPQPDQPATTVTTETTVPQPEPQPEPDDE